MTVSDHHFLYNVFRVWERPAEEILAGNIAALPLAPIARVSCEESRGDFRDDEHANP
jgi:hypothetical protein